ncbi:YwdI family protein [Pseudalkalibacillus caeni]|uniref:YwdI family protein n=1 Tax=Exobacillus caeni TaxID=2574798 RepID=A0A5R9FAE9_9BACL|nr:YwdI family protein [Pseudalkalibacillus caeni]TLS36605.1 hypothetical protein FCL54_13865 [Pseudalkalibacillus caeni]
MREIPVSSIVEKMAKKMRRVEFNIEENDADVNGIREDISAIKAYCEILLESEGAKPKPAPFKQSAPVQNQMKQQPLKSERLKEEDGNGDSIFDF